MDIKRMLKSSCALSGASGFFTACGSFGVVDAADADIERITETESGFSALYPEFSADCEIKAYKNGVFSRRDTFTASEPLTLNRYASRFLLEGGDYEVYTQYSSWLHESSGGWQSLVTGVVIANNGLRTTEAATPMVALKNKGNGVITVFHLLPNAQWKIKVSKIPVGTPYDGVLIETGITDTGLQFSCEKGESIAMPEVFVYQTRNEIDLDAWKLHEVYNSLYPRKDLPVIYNSWMYKFDRFTTEDILAQADCAAELGIEMFLIDAGWFGKNRDWGADIGDWKENLVSGFCGRLSEVSEYIRSKGMKFGLWIEPERAVASAEAVREHPEYFIPGSGGNFFLDFAREDAREYIFGVVCGLIDTYHLGIMKFDFNASLSFDRSGCGFYRYFEGQKEVISRLRERYPELHIINCASGGNRMDMGQNTLFDSVWISDNQSPVRSLKIIKETLLRLPMSSMEKWDVRRYCGGFPVYASDETATLPLSCDDATWASIAVVSEEFTHAFITGGVMGFSADIAAYPEGEKAALKKLIAEYKNDREFYKNANTRILYDNSDITVFEYSDPELNRIILHAFLRFPLQSSVTVYPAMSPDAEYTSGDELFSAAELLENGYVFPVSENHCFTVEFLKREN